MNRRTTSFGRLLLILVMMTTTIAATASQSSPSAEQNILEVFVRDGCPHCAEAKTFLQGFAIERPQLQILYRQVDRDANARDDLIRYSRQAGAWPPGVPTFVFNHRVLVGFESPERTGKQLAALVEQLHTNSGEIETNWLGTISVSRLGLPLFTLAVGLLDGFNPCAMWVLLFLLSMLVHLRDRKRMAIIAGTFVLASGAIYFAFMATWLNLFLAIGMSTALRIGLGVMAVLIGAINVKDFLTHLQGLSLSIPDAAKPGIFAKMRAVMFANTLLPALAATATLAIVVNFVEILCTAGFPAIYTAILTQQDLSPAAHYGYLGLYILGYITDDALMVATAVIALSSNKLTERAGRWLKLLSGVVMLALGVVMLLRTEWLL